MLSQYKGGKGAFLVSPWRGFLSCVRVWASCVYFDPDMII